MHTKATPLLELIYKQAKLLWKWWRTSKNSSSRCNRTKMSYTDVAAKWKRERERWERTHRITWFTFDQGYIHGRENRKLIITNAVYKWKLIPKKYKASLPYISRGQNMKKQKKKRTSDVFHSTKLQCPYVSPVSLPWFTSCPVENSRITRTKLVSLYLLPFFFQ